MIRRCYLWLVPAIIILSSAASQNAVGQPIVEYTALILDSKGNQLTTIEQDTDFWLCVTVQDIRDNPTGVFSAFLDVFYDPDFMSVAGAIQHSSVFSAGTSGTTNNPGVIDEVGGVDGISPLGGDVFEVFRVPMTSGSMLGTTLVEMDPADDTILHPTTVFLGTRALLAEDMNFVPARLTVVPEPSAGAMVQVICCGLLLFARRGTTSNR